MEILDGFLKDIGSTHDFSLLAYFKQQLQRSFNARSHVCIELLLQQLISDFSYLDLLGSKATFSSVLVQKGKDFQVISLKKNRIPYILAYQAAGKRF